MNGSGGDGRRHRIMLVTDSLEVGGAEQVAVDIANSLDRDRFEVFFCATRLDGPLRHKLRDDVAVYLLGRTSTWDLSKTFQFARHLRRQHIDLVHSHGRGTMRFISLARMLGLVQTRHVYHDHFGRLHMDRSAGPTLRIPLRREVDAYIGVEARLCRWAVDVAGVPSERIHLVRSGVDLDRFEQAEPIDLRAEFGIPSNTTTLVMIANFRPQKDHPTLFRALAALPTSERGRLHVVICGSTTANDRYFRGCMEMADRLGVAEMVTIAGVRADAAAILAGADAAVFASKNESGPLVILEYMSAGLPFVATDTGEVAQSVRGRDVGFLCAPRDHIEMRDAIAEVVGMSESDRRAMGARGRALVRSEFDQRLAIRDVERVYDSVLST